MLRWGQWRRCTRRGFCYSPSAPAAAPRGLYRSPITATTGGREVDCGETAISNKVFVGNLSFDVTRDELIQAFSAAGKVVDAKVPTDRETGRPRGFAFVEFEDDDAAQKSISLMNGKDLKGRPLRVNEAENRPPRPAGMGGAPEADIVRRAAAGYRPGAGGPPSYAAPTGDFDPSFERGRPFKTKGSRRNIRRRKRGFD